jgi:hypothetical protein
MENSESPFVSFRLAQWRTHADEQARRPHGASVNVTVPSPVPAADHDGTSPSYASSRPGDRTRR